MKPKQWQWRRCWLSSPWESASSMLLLPCLNKMMLMNLDKIVVRQVALQQARKVTEWGRNLTFKLIVVQVQVLQHVQIPCCVGISPDSMLWLTFRAIWRAASWPSSTGIWPDRRLPPISSSMSLERPPKLIWMVPFRLLSDNLSSSRFPLQKSPANAQKCLHLYVANNWIITKFTDSHWQIHHNFTYKSTCLFHKFTDS